MGRKIDDKNPIPGTRKGDAGATTLMFPEKQCTKKPLPGQKLCAICLRKDDEYKAKPTTIPKDYFGLLDEPLFANSKVIGCEYFFSKYPKGLLDDPTTAPVPTAPAPVPTAPVANEIKVVTLTVTEPKKPKKPRAKKENIVVENTTVAKTDEAPVQPEWFTFLYEYRVLIRNTKDGRVYDADTNKSEREEMIKWDSYRGRWRDGELDIYAPENEETDE
jgi:hypothetical protein